MLNSVCLIGRLTKNLELRQTQSGNCYVGFTLAVRRNFVKDGQPESDFINCVTWGKTAETMCNYLSKGSLIGVDGRIQTRNYDNQQGQRVYVTEVNVQNFHFLESKGIHQEYENTEQPQKQEYQGTQQEYENTEQPQKQEYQGTQQATTKYDGVRTFGREGYNGPIYIDDSDLPF